MMHGRALLRACPLVRDDLGEWPATSDTVRAHLRRYRSLDPWTEPAAGPFDWEHNLVEDAPDDGALFFASGLLVYAAEVWRRAGAPELVVDAVDLRALFNASAVGTRLVVLPADWQGE